ncbi:MAG: 3-isopropylmalate dehydratase small subunit [Prevotellaceae bacterium]|jgi:3-isopropylmalate/(R)-2-methylmalate dehydratase small subunit|nr:3-isopropylmalate dehydratase small subunit [Prevotellaceae bacterium]
MKQKFTAINSTCVPISIENIDTDQIIPARFLKATTRSGFGENLFCDWRYDKQGKEIPEFPLNDKKYSGEILVAGKNFGCGSSREHAAWAIHDYGFKAVVSSYFADIFKNNALNNFVLPVLVSDSFLKQLFDSIYENAQTAVSINLENKIITNNSTGKSEYFEINAYKQQCLLNGFDDIDYLINNKSIIEEYEKNRKF